VSLDEPGGAADKAPRLPGKVMTRADAGLHLIRHRLRRHHRLDQAQRPRWASARCSPIASPVSLDHCQKRLPRGNDTGCGLVCMGERSRQRRRPEVRALLSVSRAGLFVPWLQDLALTDCCRSVVNIPSEPAC